jgi:hypothetical protein
MTEMMHLDATLRFNLRNVHFITVDTILYQGINDYMLLS